ncbi:MAG: PmeII family type II restriction endonuclease [Pseudoxanthomonas sp.]
MQQGQVVAGVKQWSEWWLNERLKKIRQEKHDTMEVNPFMAPLVSALHGHSDFLELAEFLLGGHFAIGHATGFGKLIDEKILPNVFGTTKLDKATRGKSKLFTLACFDNVDHIVHKDGTDVLLSLKASRWTIQLGQAVELNKSFKTIHELLEKKEHTHDKVVVGVFYGKADTLTDKYRLVRGISGDVKHDVHDIQEYVNVLAGQEFWAWLGDHPDTQLWVMEGIQQAIESKRKELQEAQKLMAEFRNSFARRYADFIDQDGIINWVGILKATNGG